MLRYLQDEHQAKKSTPFDSTGWRQVRTTQDPFDFFAWRQVRTTQDTPRQMNGYDCGVFATFCAHYLSVGAHPTHYTAPQ